MLQSRKSYQNFPFNTRAKKSKPRFCERKSTPDEPLLLDTNSNKCPPTQDLLKSWKETDKFSGLHLLSEVAYEVGFIELGFKLSHCGTDAIIHRSPQGKLGHTLLRCNHRLCPICHEWRAKELRARLKKVIENGSIFVTLTMRTVFDWRLKENINILRRALRSLNQRKKKRDWVPFERGYFWRLEVTTGKGFHPHLHLIVDENYIDYYALKRRWSQSLARLGGEGNFIYLHRTNERSIYEVAKYLSKDLAYFEPERWQHLSNGLEKVRTYGSGGSLKLPPREKKGYSRVCFASELNDFSDEELLAYNLENGLWDDLSDGNSTRSRLHKLAMEFKNSGYSPRTTP